MDLNAPPPPLPMTTHFDTSCTSLSPCASTAEAWDNRSETGTPCGNHAILLHAPQAKVLGGLGPGAAPLPEVDIKTDKSALQFPAQSCDQQKRQA